MSLAYVFDHPLTGPRDGRFSFQSGCEAAEALLALRSRPTAVLASNDDMALGVQWIAQQSGLRIPADLAIAAFDDTAASRMAGPPLTVAAQPMARMADAAITSIVACLLGQTGLPSGELILSHALLLRTCSSSP